MAHQQLTIVPLLSNSFSSYESPPELHPYSIVLCRPTPFSTTQQLQILVLCYQCMWQFCLTGTADDWIERFNLQSGISRGSYLDASERGSCAHNGEVVGIACDATNTLMISTGYHGNIKVWDFKGAGTEVKVGSWLFP